jgi:hypothetical protein
MKCVVIRDIRSCSPLIWFTNVTKLSDQTTSWPVNMAGCHQAFYCMYRTKQEPGSSVSIVTGRPGFDPRQRQRIFPLISASRPALGPTQPPVQWVPGALSPGVKRGRGVLLTTHPLLVQRLRKSRSYISYHPNAPVWSVTGPLYLTELNTVISRDMDIYPLFPSCMESFYWLMILPGNCKMPQRIIILKLILHLKDSVKIIRKKY